MSNWAWTARMRVWPSGPLTGKMRPPGRPYTNRGWATGEFGLLRIRGVRIGGVGSATPGPKARWTMQRARRLRTGSGACHRIGVRVGRSHVLNRVVKKTACHWAALRPTLPSEVQRVRVAPSIRSVCNTFAEAKWSRGTRHGGSIFSER